MKPYQASIPEQTDFPIRAYTKKELALCYFPNADPHVATNRLTQWVKRCTDLWTELLQTGYQPTQKMWTARQVRAIVYYLGEP